MGITGDNMDKINVIKISETEYVISIPMGSTIVTFKLDKETLVKLDKLVKILNIRKSRSAIIRDLVKTFTTLLENVNSQAEQIDLVMKIVYKLDKIYNVETKIPIK